MVQSSLIYKHDCQTRATRMRHKCDTSDTSETSATRVQHKCDTSASRAKRVANERLQGEKQFHFQNYLLEMSYLHTKIRLKSAPQKLDFLMTKAI